jgi:hypothetical protein
VTDDLSNALAGSLQGPGPESARLDRALQLLGSETIINERVIGQLDHHLRGGLGNEGLRASMDPDAHVRFWRILADRFPTIAKLRGLLADTLFVTGHPEDARREFLSAFRMDPRLVYSFSGDVQDLFAAGSERDHALYRALTIKAAELDDPHGNADYVRELTDGFISDYRDHPDLLRESLTIINSAPTPGEAS